MSLQRRLFFLSAAIGLLLSGGTVGFYFLGREAGGAPSLLDCLYQTLITIVTLGSREMQPLSSTWFGEAWIILLVLLGIGILGIFATTATAFLVEGEMHNVFRRRKMEKALDALSGHILVCGAGETGHEIVNELRVTGHHLALVDTNEEHIRRILEDDPARPFPYLVGAATDDHVLIKAGLLRARGLVVALPDDRDTLFVVVTARQLNPKLRIVARTAEFQVGERMKRAGADAVVSPARIGGTRIASEMIRPQVVGFLDAMIRSTDNPWRFEEIRVEPNGPLVGQTLREADILHKNDILVLAVREAGSERYRYNPPGDTRLQEGITLVVLAPTKSAKLIRESLP